MFGLPPITQSIIIAKVLMFLLEGPLDNNNLISAFALWPIGSQFMPWQVLTYAFLHGSLTHLLFNMFAVYMFGTDMERVWGGQRYLIYYLTCAAAAALSQLVVCGITGAQYPTLGASGAVFGLLLALEQVQKIDMFSLPPWAVLSKCISHTGYFCTLLINPIPYDPKSLIH